MLLAALDAGRPHGNLTADNNHLKNKGYLKR
jgi:hypothetical protein